MRAKSPLPEESYKTCLSPPARIYNNMGEVLSIGEVHWKFNAQGIYWRLSTQTLSVPNTYQDSCLSEGHVFSINFICKKSLGSLLFTGNAVNPSEFEVSKYQLRANFASSFSKDNSLRPVLTLFFARSNLPFNIQSFPLISISTQQQSESFKM